MFKYGKGAGIMTIVLIVLAVIPVLVALSYVPGMADQVPMKVSESGEVLRMGSKYELAFAPVLCAVFGFMAYGNAGRQAAGYDEGDPMRKLTYTRFIRNGLVICVVLNLASYYVIYMAVTGHGIGF